MSTALAIAGVTAVLRDRLNDGLVNHDVSGIVGGNIEVSALPPDRILANGAVAQPQLNIYMYLVTSNTAWRNECYPSHNSAGQRVNKPPLALDLHYLLTAYGASDLQSEILLGYTTQLMHENPVLGRASINAALNPSPDVGVGLPPALQALASSGLADQLEQIKFTPKYLTTEEMSKLWTAMQSSYRPTAAYEATVVLIESDVATQSALPVRERSLTVLPLARPFIDAVEPARVAVGEVAIVEGSGLSGEATQLRFGEDLLTPDSVSNEEVAITIPATLRAGVQGVQVVHELSLGDPPIPHLATDSNVAPLVILPTITNALPVNTNAGATLAINVTPDVDRSQKVSLLIGAEEIGIPSRPASDPPSSGVLNFPIPASMPVGNHLLRLRVDGAESSLSVDAVSGNYNGPIINIA